MASASEGGGEREKRLGVPREGSCTHKPQDSNSYDIVERILSRNDDDYMFEANQKLPIPVPIPVLCLESIIIPPCKSSLLLMMIIPSYSTLAALSRRLWV